MPQDQIQEQTAQRRAPELGSLERALFGPQATPEYQSFPQGPQVPALLLAPLLAWRFGIPLADCALLP